VAEKKYDSVAFLLASGAFAKVQKGRFVKRNGIITDFVYDYEDDRCSLVQLAAIKQDRVAVELLVAGGAEPPVASESFPTVVIDAAGVKAAKKRISLAGFRACRARMLEICIALQTADLPAPLTTEILVNAHRCAPWSGLLPYYFLWNTVTSVKHFHQRHQEQSGGGQC
jgi:hypothetical protein